MNWQFLGVNPCLTAVGWRLVPGSLAALTVGILLRLGAWMPLEQAVYNTLFLLRGPLQWDERIVIVAIDDATLQRLGQFPIKRQYYAQLIDRLALADPSVITLNLVFADPSADDQQLAAAIARYGQVVLAQAQSGKQVIVPLPKFEQGAIAIGQVANRPDADGITRKVWPVEAGTPTLSLATLMAYRLVQEPIPLPNLEQPLWINWISPASQAPQYSLIDVLQNRVPLGKFHNKIVLVGNTAAGLDSLTTPFDKTPPTTGVYLHATLLNNLLRQNSLKVPHPFWVVFSVGVVSTGLGIVLLGIRWHQRLLLLVCLCLGWGLVALLGFQAGYWLPVALPLGAIAITMVFVEVSERLRLDVTLQQEMVRLWQVYSQEMPAWSNSKLLDDAVSPVPLPAAPLVNSHLEGFSSAVGGLSSDSLANLTKLAEQFAEFQTAQAAIAQSLSLGLLAADAQGRVWFFNPVAADWLSVRVGYSLENCLIPDWLSKPEWQTIWKTLHNGQTVSQDVQHGDRWFSLKFDPLFAHPTKTSNAETSGWLLTLEDVTHRKQTEGEIHQTLVHEKEMNQLKTQFISMISHEFRTPLTIIQSSADLLEYYDWSSADKQGQFQQIRDSVLHMTQLLEDVLLIGKAEAQTLQYKPQSIDLNQFCQDLLTTFQVTAGRSRQMVFVTQGTPQTAWFDPKLLRQILNNLLSNAIKYSTDGSTVTLELIYQVPTDVHALDAEPLVSGAQPNRVIFHIKDQGIGIPPEDQEKLFHAFYRASNVEQIQGTGLGLMIVKKCVDQMQGQIRVDSEVDLGTTFTVILPLTVSESSQD